MTDKPKVVPLAKPPEEWTVCKVCNEPMKKGGRWWTCCSAQCYRDAYIH